MRKVAKLKVEADALGINLNIDGAPEGILIEYEILPKVAKAVLAEILATSSPGPVGINYFDFLDRVSVTVVFGCRAAVEALTNRPEIALRLTVTLPLPARLLIPFHLSF